MDSLHDETGRYNTAQVRNPNSFPVRLQAFGDRALAVRARRAATYAAADYLADKSITGLDVNAKDGVIAKAWEPVITISYPEVVRRAVPEVHPTTVCALGLDPQEVELALATMP